MDELQRDASALVLEAARAEEAPAVTFYRLRELAGRRAGRPVRTPFRRPPRDRPMAPRLTEPWFC